MQKALEGCASIHMWIDWIFGLRSRQQPAVESQNLFHPKFYEKSKEETAPVQLFTKLHPPRAACENPKVWDSPRINFQGLVRINRPSGLFDVVLAANNMFAAVSRASRYTQGVVLRHANFEWLLGDDGSVFDCTALSSDSMFFCRVVPIGIVLVYSGMHYSKLVSQCFLPIELMNGKMSESCQSCCISSHIGIVCEAFCDVICTFHVASGAFLRMIQVVGSVKMMAISNSRQFIVAVGDKFVQLFTVNGTPVAKVENVETITTAAVTDGSDFVVATAHSTAAGAAVINLWALDSVCEGLVRLKTIAYRESPICTLTWFNGNAALFVIEENGGARLIIAPSKGHRLSLNAKQIDACAICQKRGTKFDMCSVCGMFTCKKCRTKEKTCRDCLKSK